MKLMVLFMHQLQLIGIKTNLESFVTTTLMEHMLNRHQLHLFLWVSKQWGTCGSGINNLPLSFNEKIFICVVTDITSSTTSSDGYFSFNNDKSTINSIFITSSGAYGGNYIVAGV